jgi:hypothetical protein
MESLADSGNVYMYKVASNAACVLANVCGLCLIYFLKLFSLLFLDFLLRPRIGEQWLEYH